MTGDNRDRPQMPHGYGVPEAIEGMLSWDEVEARLVASEQYWMATTREDGRPHVVPRWGVWIDGKLFYDGSPETVHVKNLKRNPACTLHLEDGWQAVVVEGESGPTASPGIDLGKRIASAMSGKYGPKGYSPEPDSWEGPEAGGLCCFIPSKALAWFDFPNDVTRFDLT
ncbi:MAG TPA: pyridoxamine 5'-phosphate oxidase family protein [Acidimicrobiia bacterium]